MKIVIFLILLVPIDGFSQICSTADSLKNVGQFELARLNYLSCREDSISYSYSLSECTYNLGLWDASKKHLSVILNKNNLDLKANALMAKIYEKELNIPKAIKYYTTLTQIDATNAYYFRKIAEQYSKVQSPIDAETYYNESLKRNKKDVLTILSLVNINLQKGDIHKADSLVKMAKLYAPKNIRTQLLSSKIDYMNRKYALVFEHLKALSSKTTLDYKMNTILGYSALYIDSLDAAIKYLNTSKILNPNAENNYYYLGLIAYKQGEYKSAKQYYKEAINRGISNKIPKYYKALAQTAQADNDFTSVINYYKKAIPFDKKGDNYFYLAEACFKYYKDKSVALNYYNKHVNSNSPNKNLLLSSKEKIIWLKNYNHMKNIK